MLDKLPDPRRIIDHTLDDELIEEAIGISKMPVLDSRKRLLRLRKLIKERLLSGREEEIRETIYSCRSEKVLEQFLSALDSLFTERKRDRIWCLVFAIPILVVMGGKRGDVINAVLPDVENLVDLFRQKGILGANKNFAFSNALTSLDAIEAIKWRDLVAESKSLEFFHLNKVDAPPADFVIERSTETVHLRYLPGITGITNDSPNFLETGGNIGEWGSEFSKEVAAQLGSEKVTLLPLARPPECLPRAIKTGVSSIKEIGFQLFLSGVLRLVRLRSGEPDISVTSCSDNSIRIRVTSVFDDTIDQTYIWKLNLYDDWVHVKMLIESLFKDMNVHVVKVIESVVAVDKE